MQYYFNYSFTVPRNRNSQSQCFAACYENNLINYSYLVTNKCQKLYDAER